MRRAYCLLIAVAACGAPAPQYRPAFVDPALGGLPAEAMAAWQLATGGRFPEHRMAFRVTDGIDSAAKIVESDGKSEDYIIYVSAWLPRELHRRALVHEIGHSAWMLVEPDSGDPYHYRGPASSVMRPELNDCSDEIGQPELAAFARKYGR